MFRKKSMQNTTILIDMRWPATPWNDYKACPNRFQAIKILVRNISRITRIYKTEAHYY